MQGCQFSLLPGEVSIRVLPGDKMYQGMEIEPHYMRPVILHGFGTNAKKRMPSSLADLAQYGCSFIWYTRMEASMATSQFPSSGWSATVCQSAFRSLSPVRPRQPESSLLQSRSFMAAMFLLVFWLLFSGP